MSDILDWAKKEVEIACKKENPNKKKKVNLITDVPAMKVH